MARKLKTKFPCRECGKPADVTRLSWAEYAICDACVSRRRHMQTIDYSDREVERNINLGNDTSKPEPERLARWLRAIAAEVEASAKCMESVGCVHPGETLHMWRCALSRLRSAERTIPKLTPLFESARAEIVKALRVEVLDGGCTDYADGPRPAPALRLLKDGG